MYTIIDELILYCTRQHFKAYANPKSFKYAFDNKEFFEERNNSVRCLFRNLGKKRHTNGFLGIEKCWVFHRNKKENDCSILRITATEYSFGIFNFSWT